MSEVYKTLIDGSICINLNTYTTSILNANVRVQEVLHIYPHFVPISSPPWNAQNVHGVNEGRESEPIMETEVGGHSTPIECLRHRKIERGAWNFKTSILLVMTINVGSFGV